LLNAGDFKIILNENKTNNEFMC